MVVLPPESQVAVPPVAKATADSGCEPPPVLPPVHPDTVTVDEAFPEKFVQVMELDVQETVNDFGAVIEPSVAIHTSPTPLLGSSTPSPLSVVTGETKLSARGSDAAPLTYPGQCVAEIGVSTGAPMVVLEPETQ